MVAEVMVTVSMAAARAAVVAALYNILSADAPVGAPPEGNAKEVTRRHRRQGTTISWRPAACPPPYCCLPPSAAAVCA
jgi:hypothetical protein